MTSTTRSILGSILILISTLCLAFLSSRMTGGMGWMDLTSNSRYTLTDGTKNILKKMRRPLTAKLYFSQTSIDTVGTDQLMQFVTAHVYARDLLRAYEAESEGKLTFEEYDPIQFSDAAEEAAELGVRIERLTDSLTFAFGLAVTSDTGAKEVIPFINAREEGLFEYKITKLIERVSKPSKKKLGIVSGLNVVGDNLSPEMQRLYQAQGRQAQRAWNIVQWLQADYEVEKIETTAKEIPEGIDYLMVIHPKKFTDEIFYAIDQFVMRGGKLIAFADPFCEVDQAPPNPQNPYAQFTHDRTSDFNRLLGAWGARMDTGKIIGDREITLMQNGVQHMPWCIFVEDCFNKEEVVTQALDKGARVVMVGAAAIQKSEGGGSVVTPLIQTTAKGGTRKYGNTEMMSSRSDPASLWRPGNPAATSEAEKVGFEAAGAPVAAAVTITGKLQSAFPDGLPKSASNGAEEEPKKDGEDEKEEPEHLKECVESNSVVVFGDVDILGDRFTTPPQSFFGSALSNKAVVYNALDYLSGSSDLINIRSRGSARREFDRINAIRKEAAEKTADKQAAIQSEIDAFQAELSSLNSQATQKNVGQLRGEALKKERETKLNIERKKKELNDVKRDSTIAEEGVKKFAQFFDILGMPMLVALIGLGLWIMRITKRTQQIREDMA